MAKQEITGEIVSFDLPSGISVEIQELTAASQKVFTDKQLVKSGKWLNRLLRHALVSLDGKPLPENAGEANSILLDMKSGDRNYLLLQVRMQNFGEEMDFNYECPKCKKTAGYHINFKEALDNGTLKVYPYREDMPIEVETRSGVALVDYPTGRTEEWLSMQKDPDIILNTMGYCASFNGHPPTYKEFEALYAKDLTKIRLAGDELKGGLDSRIELECAECDSSFSIYLYQIPDFFIPQMTTGSIGL